MLTIKKTKISSWHYFLIVILVVATFFHVSPLAHGSSPGYAASDVIGQVDRNGQPDFNQGRVAANRISNPGGQVYDTVHHRLFLCDVQNNHILVYNLTTDNQLTSRYADNVLGQADFSGHESVTSQNRTTAPQDVAYDSASNRLFVADTSNQRVLVYDLSSGITNGMNASYVLGQPDFTTAGSPGVTQAKTTAPRSVEYDTTHHRLFVADTDNNRVLVYDLSSGITNGMNASYVLGQSSFTSSTPGTTQGIMSHPNDVSYDDSSNRIFVADGQNARILVYDLSSGITNGMNASNVLGQPNFTSSNGSVTQNGFSFSLLSVAFDSAHHRLFAADTDHNRVLVYDLSSGITNGMNASYVLGEPDFNTSDAGSGDSLNGMSRPTSVAYDNVNDRVVVADGYNTRLLQFNTATITNNMDGVVVAGGITRDGLMRPAGTAMDTVHHRLFVADSVQSRILVYDLDSSNNLTDHTPDNVLGQPDFVHADHHLTQSGMFSPTTAFYDTSANRLFVGDANNNRIMVYDLSSGITNGMNASYVLGQPDFTTSSSDLTQSALAFPGAGVAYDATTHYLYVGDGNNRIMVYDLSGGITNGMNASYVLGQPDFTTSNYDTLQNGFGYLYGMTLDAVHHRLFVADWGSAGRVLVFDVSSLTNGMNASNVLGEADFTSSNSAVDNGSTPDAKSFGPSGLGYDSLRQRLFVEDEAIGRVLVFDVSNITNNQDAIGVIGQPDFTSADVGQSQTRFNDLTGYSDYFDSNNNRLYVADEGADRILTFSFVRLTTDSLTSGSMGANYDQLVGAANSQGAKTFAVTSGNLPAGLALDTTTGAISGIPTTAGTYNFTLTVADDNGAMGRYTDSKDYSIAISDSNTTTTPPASDNSSTQQQSTSDNGGSNSGTSGDNNTPTTTDANTTSEPIILNSFDEFSAETGKTITDLKTGDVLQFCLGTRSACDANSPDHHTITVKDIDFANKTVTLTFASTPTDYVFHLNAPQSVDVDHDGTNDVSGTLISLAETMANFTFKSLSQTTKTPATTQTQTPSTETKPASNSMNIWWWIAGAVIVVLVIIITLARRGSRRAQQ